jgi:PPOX class probable F420-dependent enzyme
VQLTSGRARDLFAARTVARLATADEDGRPHLVPLVFVVLADVIYSVIDGKPKSGRPLRRLANIERNSRVSVLADHYDDDWSQLWWARADGTARILELTALAEPAVSALDRLAERYPQYRLDPPPGPMIAIDVARWSGWAAQPNS